MAVEEDRLAGRVGCAPEELDKYLDGIIDEVAHEGAKHGKEAGVLHDTGRGWKPVDL